MDPLSIAAGTAGFLSLGIQVSKGIIAFCQDYHSIDTDVATLLNQAERLDRFAVLADTQLRKGAAPQAELSSLFAECFRAANDCSNSIDEVIGLIKSTKMPKSSRARFRRLAYPLKDKRRLEELHEQVQQVRSNLALSLQLLNLDHTEANYQKSHALSLQIVAQGHRLTDQLSCSMPTLASKLNQGLVRMDDMNDSLIQLREMHDALLSALPSISQSPLHPSSSPRHQKTGHSQHLGLVSNSEKSATSSNSLSPGSKQQIDISPNRTNSETQQVQSNLTTRCMCTAQLAITHGKHRGESRLSKQYSHQESCPFSIRSRASYEVTGRFRVFNLLLKCQISMRYSRRAILRSLEIHPNFTLRAIVSSRSPPWEVIGRTFPMFSRGRCRDIIDRSSVKPLPTSHVLSIFQDCLGKLYELFCNGKAWPTNVNSRGEGLLEWSLLLSQDLTVDILTTENGRVWLQFLQELVRLRSYGCETIFRGFVSRIGWASLYAVYSGANWRCFSMVDELVGLLYKASGLPDGSAVAHYQDPISQLIAASTHGHTRQIILEQVNEPLSMALINRNEKHVLECLSNIRSTPNGVMTCHEFPLHLSVCWPRGLNLFIQSNTPKMYSIINLRNHYGLTALKSSIFLAQADSARVLLENGAFIGVSDLFAFNMTCGRYESTLRGILAQGFAKKHGLLEGSVDPTSSPFESNMGPMQGHIHIVRRDLWNGGFQQHLPSPEDPQTLWQGTLYHVPFSRPKMAEALFLEGFSSVDIAINGLTPLMMLLLALWSETYGLNDLLDQAAWLLDRGACMNDPIPREDSYDRSSDMTSRQRAVHRFGALIGEGLGYPGCGSLSKKSLCTSREILDSKLADTCACYCAPFGCQAATVFAHQFCEKLRGEYLLYLRRQYNQDRMAKISSFSKDKELNYFFKKNIINMAKTVSGCPTGSLAVIRALTFDRLGMKHTCCSWNHLSYRWNGIVPYYVSSELLMLRSHIIFLQGEQSLFSVPDPDEITEIQEEDKYLADDLEELMANFESEFQNSDTDISKFLLGYWSDTMNEYETQKDTMSSKDVDALRDTGVQLWEN